MVNFGLWACSKSSKPEAAQLTSGDFTSVREDATIYGDPTNRTIDGTYIDEQGQGFSYVHGLSASNLTAFTA